MGMDNGCQNRTFHEIVCRPMKRSSDASEIFNVILIFHTARHFLRDHAGDARKKINPFIIKRDAPGQHLH